MFTTFKELQEEKSIAALCKIAAYNGILESDDKAKLLTSIKEWALRKNFHGMIPVVQRDT